MNLLTRKLFLLCCLHFFNYAVAKAGDCSLGSLCLTEDLSKGVRVGPYVEYFEDTSTKLVLPEVIQKWTNFNPVPNHGPVVNLGTTLNPIWLRLRLENPFPSSMEIVFENTYPSDSLKIYPVFSDGRIETHILGYKEHQIGMLPHRNGSILIRVPPGSHAVFFRFTHLGVVKFDLKAWDARTFLTQQIPESIWIGVFLGSAAVMVLYNACMLLILRTRLYLYYVLFLLFACSGLVSYTNVARMFPDPIKQFFGYQWLSLQSAAVLFLAAFTSEFLNLRMRSRRFYLFFRMLIATCLSCIVLTQISPLSAFKIFNIAGGVILLACFVATIHSCLARYRPAFFYLLSFLSLIAASMVEILVLNGVLTESFSSWPFLCGFSIQGVLISLAVGDQIRLTENAARHRITILNKDLQHHIDNINQIVEEKTRNIRSLLKAIHQGIFTVESTNGEFVIGSEYSDHLCSLLETSPEGGENLDIVLLNKTDLTSDQKNIIKSVLSFSIGEPYLSFEFNQMTLPSELQLQSHTGKSKSIIMEWSPIINEKSQTIERFLLALRDVTELKNLEEMAKEHQSEVKVITDIVSIGIEKFKKFTTSSRALIEENRKLIEKMLYLDLEVLKILYINMHTLKGNARAYGLVRLTEKVHQAEQYYSQLQKGVAIFDRERVLKELDEVDESFEPYEIILQEKFHAHVRNDKIEVDLHKIGELAGTIQKMESDASSTLTFSSGLQRMKRLAVEMYYENAHNLFNQLLTCLNTLSKDLEKPCPLIVVDASDVYFTRQTTSILGDCFQHLLRNSMDHGIEFPDSRLQKGKTREGHISISVREVQGYCEIIYSDDGGGLNLDRILAKAKEQYLVQPNETLDAIEIVSLLFEPGFSTANTISMISGRGMGLEAIRTYIGRIGGSTTINLPSSLQSRIVPFSMTLTLPHSEFVILKGHVNRSA